MALYSQAFTAASANSEKNYEFFEQIGDLAANQFLVSYTYRKYPQLQCAQGVKIVARVRINYGSKEKFAELADKLGFWRFISAVNKAREKSKKDLLEDTFEAFCGVTQWLLDSRIRIGVGYAILYSVLNSIYKEFVPISLRYEDLFDAKTRLKELFDRPDVKANLGDWTFRISRERAGRQTYDGYAVHCAALRTERKTTITGDSGSLSPKAWRRRKLTRSRVLLRRGSNGCVTEDIRRRFQRSTRTYVPLESPQHHQLHIRGSSATTLVSYVKRSPRVHDNLRCRDVVGWGPWIPHGSRSAFHIRYWHCDHLRGPLVGVRGDGSRMDGFFRWVDVVIRTWMIRLYRRNEIGNDLGRVLCIDRRLTWSRLLRRRASIVVT